MSEFTIWCPKCKKIMVIRHRHNDGAAFFGCSDYPNCKVTVSYNVGKRLITSRFNRRKKKRKGERNLYKQA